MLKQAAAQEKTMLNSRKSNFQSKIFGRDENWRGRFVLWNIDLASWFLEGGEAEAAEDEEGGQEGEEDEGGEEAVGGEEERVDKAGISCSVSSFTLSCATIDQVA